MADTVRRVVTGHDAAGKSVFAIDEQVDAVSPLGAQLWSTATAPADNDDCADGRHRQLGITSPGGSVIRILSFPPGARSPMHRTSTLDYGILLDGEMWLELDDGAVTKLDPGDVVVQRGTMHAWENRSAVPCRMAFVLIDAVPVEIGGERVEPTHI